jgi:hypothetical protein
MKMPAAGRADGIDLASLGEATQTGLSLSTDMVSVAGISKWQTSQMEKLPKAVFTLANFAA